MFKRFLAHLSFVLTLFMAFSLSSHAQSDSKIILVMGDSLSAGYGLPQDKSFPSQLETWFENNGHNVRVVNAGVSGDTSAGGLARLDWALAGLNKKPDLVIVEFGGNDALRGISPLNTKENLNNLLSMLGEKTIPSYLMGMQAPPNLGAEYASEFNRLYSELAQEHNVPLYPFFLDGVAAIPELNLADGIHPNGDGIAIIVERLGPLALGFIN